MQGSNPESHVPLTEPAMHPKRLVILNSILVLYIVTFRHPAILDGTLLHYFIEKPIKKYQQSQTGKKK